MKNNISVVVAFICVWLCLSATYKDNRYHPKPSTASTVDTINVELFAPGTKPKLISSQFTFTEGPAVDKRGNVFFTDQPNDQIWEYSAGAKLSLFLSHSSRSNGMYFDKRGNLISCADENEQLISIDPKGKIKVLVNKFQGHKLNGPNDLWVNTNGGIYFTDPYYQRPYWTRTKPDLAGQNVYFLPAGSSSPVVVADDLQQPNGIVGAPDGKYLYVADIKANKTYKYVIDAKGTLSGKILFCEQGSDGMTLDNLGDVYLTGKGVTIYDANGKKFAHIDINEPWTGNLCFGGKNRDQLFITASKAVYIMPMKVKGVE